MNCSKLTEYDAESITCSLIHKTLADISVLQCNSGTRNVLESGKAQHGMVVLLLWQAQQWGAGGDLSSVTTTQADCALPFFFQQVLKWSRGVTQPVMHSYQEGFCRCICRCSCLDNTLNSHAETRRKKSKKTQSQLFHQTRSSLEMYAITSKKQLQK